MKSKMAFTLAEATAVLVFLGIVIALVLPTSYRNAVIRSNRLKLRKASSVYQQFIERIIIEYDLPRNEDYINSFAKENNCAVIREYYKVPSSYGSTCKFMTKNGIYWDFSSGITKVLLSFEEKYLTADEAESDNMNTFYMVSTFANDGALHINDVGYEDTAKTNNLWHVKKIDCFINEKKCKASDYIKKD